MNQQASQLLTEALRLSEEERGDIAASLIDSLDPGSDADAEAAWGEEIRLRLAELDAGSAQPVPWPEARRMITEDGDDPVES
jgi:putative addiction module component (TIGR02574 family)